MRRITEEHLADLCEADYRNLMGVTREEFGRMLQALEEGYRREHKRKPRFTKITMVDKLILTLTYRLSVSQHGQHCKGIRSLAGHHFRQHPLGGTDPAERRSAGKQRDLRV